LKLKSKLFNFGQNRSNPQKRNFESALNRFPVHKIKTFTKGFCFPNLFKNDFWKYLGLLRGEVFETKPFHNPCQTGLFGQKMF
jgi:hypothetical protein